MITQEQAARLIAGAERVAEALGRSDEEAARARSARERREAVLVAAVRRLAGEGAALTPEEREAAGLPAQEKTS